MAIKPRGLFSDSKNSRKYSQKTTAYGYFKTAGLGGSHQILD